MKKFLFVTLLVLLIFLVGCNAAEKISQPVDTKENEEVEEIEEVEEEIIEVSEGSTSNTTENNSIYEKFDEVYDLREKDEVHIRKINEEKFLVGFQEQFGYQMNPMFHIYNLTTEESIPVDGQLEFVDEIRIENNKVEFFSKGTNIINGFKKFPNITEVDIDTGVIKNYSIYSRLGSDYKPYYLGNFMNETKLNALKIVDQKIVFDFSVSEGSFLAGGDHCPNIAVISENKNYISVDVENLVLNEEEIETLTLTNEKFIKDIKNTSYIDGRDISHSVINFHIEDFTEYTCNFETGNDGIKDLVISFK